MSSEPATSWACSQSARPHAVSFSLSGRGLYAIVVIISVQCGRPGPNDDSQSVMVRQSAVNLSPTV